MKKVLCIIDNLNTGGAEQVFSDISYLLLGYVNFDVLLILPPQNENYSLPSDIRKLYLNRSNKWSLLSFYKCFRILKKYDIIHIHLRHTFRYIAIINKIFFINKILILHDHGSIGIEKKPPFIGYQFLKPDIYIGVSEELKLWAISTWKIPKYRTYTFINLPSERFLAGISLKSKNYRNGLVIVGNIKPVKNQLFAIEISALLKLPLTIIGKNQDAVYSEKIKQISARKSFIWLEDENDVSDLLGNFTLGLYCSLSESGPLVILEYLLCGLPFVAYKTGGIAEVINRYFPEFFLNSFDLNEWTERIIELLEKPKIIDSEKLKQMLEIEFNPAIYRNRLLELYEQN
jgi:glycosyltransferase involved in cell wall biosynthesis